MTGPDPTRIDDGDGLRTDEPDLRWVLAVVLLGMFTTSFPLTLLAASLDTIRADFGTSLSTITWLQVAPTLAAGVAVPIFGKLCDLVGPRRMFLLGTGSAAVVSVLTAGAWDVGSLIALRTVGQTVAAAATPAGFAIVTRWFTGAERPRAIARVSSVAAIAPITGVAVGGPLVDWLGWPVLFLLQAIPAAVAFVVGLRHLPPTTARRQVSFDLAGAALLGLSVVAALFGLNRIREWGIASPGVIASLLAAPVLGAVFVAVERTRAHPLLPLAYLRRRDLGFAQLTICCIQVMFQGVSIVIPLLLYRRFGYTLAVVSFLAAIRPLGFVLGAWWSPRVRGRIGATQAQVVGSVLGTFAGCALTAAAASQVLPVLVATFAVTGFASGVAFTTAMTSINDLADPADVGVVNGITQMMTTVGGAAGVTIGSLVIGDSAAASTFTIAFAVLTMGSVLSVVTALVARSGSDGPGSSPTTRVSRRRGGPTARQSVGAPPAP